MERLIYSYNDWRSYELYHHGIKGQKWGVRRYQNLDGSFTDEGRKHYGYAKSDRKQLARDVRRSFNSNIIRAKDYRKGLNELKKSKQLIEASKSLSESCSKMMDAQYKLEKARDDFQSNDKLVSEYAKKRADRIINDYQNEINRIKRDARPSQDEIETRKEKMRDYYNNTKDEHVQLHAWQEYRLDHKEINDADWDFLRAQGEFIKESRDLSNELLKEYGDIKIQYTTNAWPGKKMNTDTKGVVEAALRELSKDSYKIELSKRTMDAWSKSFDAETKYRNYIDEQREKLAPKYEKEYEKQFGKKYDKNDYDAWEWVEDSTRDAVGNGDKKFDKLLDDYFNAKNEYLDLRDRTKYSQ